MSQVLNTPNRYGWPSKTFHWVSVVIILTQYAYGFSFVVARETRVQIFDSLVESLGFLLIPITIARILWILYAGRPHLPDSTSPGEKRAARSVQLLLYFMILYCATTGFMIRDQNMFFYFIEAPEVLHFREEPLLNRVHDIGVYVLLALITLHVAAGIYHLFKRDGVVGMMTR